MAFPEEVLRQEALLCLIYLQGNAQDDVYQLPAKDTYESLAEFFGLSESDRTRLEGDGKRNAWMINIQGTRERLAQKGYIKRPPPSRVWILTSEGVEAAKNLVHRYEGLLGTPVAADLNEPFGPGRTTVSIYRILRDTAMARRVKSYYKYQCQICGYSIELSKGLKYAESHHIRPLGSPHNGPDIEANIICVCPNHHAQLDYGAISIEPSTLDRHSEHKIDPEFVEYHNSRIWKR